jgi:hypothetical protein
MEDPVVLGRGESILTPVTTESHSRLNESVDAEVAGMVGMGEIHVKFLFQN